MDRMPIDESLAFTARLELAPGLAGEAGQQWQRDLLAAWYRQTAVRDFWKFARQWQNGRAA
jgi:hypothetical protein